MSVQNQNIEESSNLIPSRHYNSTNNNLNDSNHNFKLHNITSSKLSNFQSSNKWWNIWACIITCMVLILSILIVINPNHNNSIFSLHNNSGSKSSLAKSPYYIDDPEFCGEERYLKKTLDIAYESKIPGLLLDHKGANNYEASAIQFDEKNGVFYVAFDSLYSIGRIDYFLHRSKRNILIADDKNRTIGDSGFEGLFLDPDSLSIFLLTEAVASTHKGEKFRAVVHKININSLDEEHDGKSAYYNKEHACKVKYDFRDENKGLESLSVVKNSTGFKYLLGLCEGNYCLGGKEGKEKGHGKVIIISDTPKQMEEKDSDGYYCEYQVIDEINLPSSVKFSDYSAFNFRAIEGHPKKLRAAIVSQEDSSVWIGEYYIDDMKFSDEGEIYQFPRGPLCNVQYCNVEGIAWLDDYTLVATSDRMKGKAKQNFYCADKDQSIHIFTLPN